MQVRVAYGCAMRKRARRKRPWTYQEALEVALCFGWIDGQKRSEDQHHWLQRWTPRAARSIWSRVNRDKALGFIAEGKMQPAGLAEVERAQQDGRWDAAYEPASAAQVPPDLEAAFDAHPGAPRVLRHSQWAEPLRGIVSHPDRRQARHARAPHRHLCGHAGARRNLASLDGQENLSSRISRRRRRRP